MVFTFKSGFRIINLFFCKQVEFNAKKICCFVNYLRDRFKIILCNLVIKARNKTHMELKHAELRK